jgi:rhodanese-related sulfurtransferase
MTVQSVDERGLPPGYPFNPDWETTPREYVRRRDAGEQIVLLDCRTVPERDLASIAGAVHMPMHELGARIEELRAHESTPVVVFCHHGARSLQVTAALRQAGFDDVRSMAGGIHLWSLDIDPSVAVY